MASEQLELHKNQCEHVPGIVDYISVCTRIGTHCYKGHNPWHTVYDKLIEKLFILLTLFPINRTIVYFYFFPGKRFCELSFDEIQF